MTTCQTGPPLRGKMHEMSSETSLQPLEVLFETRDRPLAKLPQELVRLYGGGLGFEEPRLYANFVSTLDGVVAIPSIASSNTLINMGSEADRFVMGLLRAFADVVLIGSGVMKASPRGTWRPEKVYPPAAAAFAELRRSLGQPEGPQVAILTGSGSIDPGHPVLEVGAVVLTSAAGAERLVGRLPAAASLVVLGEGATIDAKRVVDALQERGHRLILSEAGPHTFGSLLAAGVVDELFLTVSPLLVGDVDSLRLVEGADLLEHDVRLLLASARRSDHHLFLHYLLER
jgi:riboflavin biosynthesis pyrimidine reductase